MVEHGHAHSAVWEEQIGLSEKADPIDATSWNNNAEGRTKLASREKQETTGRVVCASAKRPKGAPDWFQPCAYRYHLLLGICSSGSPQSSCCREAC
jgi:hypothetical protein